MNKKLNGFNNGRDTTDGIGGNEGPFEEQILKVSSEWEKELLKDGWMIMDPDGWDRTNYEYSFNQEKITKEEFNRRVGISTMKSMEWIRRTHKLPEDLEEIWIYDEQREVVCQGYYASSMQTFFNQKGTGIKAYYWQPINKPEPPKI